MGSLERSGSEGTSFCSWVGCHLIPEKPAEQIAGILPGRYDETVSTDEFKTEAQLNRQKDQRLANELAQTQNQPLPFPSIWDDLDPTKLDKGATPEEITQRYQDFCALCPPPPRKEYTI